METDIIKGLKRYVNYIFDTKSFAPNFDIGDISDHALQTAKWIRGVGRDPAIIIHGIMKRSGTLYTGELLRLHPDLHAYPSRVWEIPFLPLAGDILRIQRDFFFAYEQNVGKIGENDFLPLFGSSFIAYLYSSVPEGKRMLLKMPDVQYLNYFFSAFPDENLLLLVRDGRDVVTSTIKAWPQIRFSHACRRWDRSARMVLGFHERYSGRPGYWLAKFEDATRDPMAFVKEACKRFDLDESKYPYEEIESIPVHGSSTLKRDGKLVGYVLKPEGFNPIGRWQEWSWWKKWLFKRIAGQTLVDLGYCDDLDW